MEGGIQNVLRHIPTRSYVLWDEQLPTNVSDVHEYDPSRHPR